MKFVEIQGRKVHPDDAEAVRRDFLVYGNAFVDEDGRRMEPHIVGARLGGKTLRMESWGPHKSGLGTVLSVKKSS